MTEPPSAALATTIMWSCPKMNGLLNWKILIKIKPNLLSNQFYKISKLVIVVFFNCNYFKVKL